MKTSKCCVKFLSLIFFLKCHKTVESVTQPQEPEMCFIAGKFSFSPCQTEHKTKQDMCNEKKRRDNEKLQNKNKM